LRTARGFIENSPVEILHIPAVGTEGGETLEIVQNGKTLVQRAIMEGRQSVALQR
jgi:hypothetical protein